VVAWIDSGSQIFRLKSPDQPDMHLAVYFAILDDLAREIMLVEHRKASLLLPPGGHVDPDEDPRRTVTREYEEELRRSATFHPLTSDAPLFLSVTATQGLHSHTDVTLWFLLAGHRGMSFEPDPGEFAGIGWYPLDGTDWNEPVFDPHMARFAGKLRLLLAT
jgi:8-oxo-dGTP pyrophosphatase MutT (NUDIX family)